MNLILPRWSTIKQHISHQTLRDYREDQGEPHGKSSNDLYGKEQSILDSKSISIKKHEYTVNMFKFLKTNKTRTQEPD